MRTLLLVVTMLWLPWTSTWSAAGALLFGEAASVPAYQIIVNPDNRADVVERKFVQDAFLKKTTLWPDGTVIRPADLTASSPVRNRFSEEVLNRSVDSVKNYWQQKIFSGEDVPPPEFETDDEAVAYVLKHAGGLAYVSEKAHLNGAKVVTVR